MVYLTSFVVESGGGLDVLMFMVVILKVIFKVDRLNGYLKYSSLVTLLFMSKGCPF